jgi:hypothetical protein
MKKTITNLAALVSIIIISSCQKEPSVDLPAATDRVKTYTEDITSPSTGHTVTVFNLNYDGSNRITSMVSVSDAGNKFVYTYPSANIIYSDFYSGGVLGIHYEAYMLNNRIDSAFEYNDTNDSTTQKFIYNSSGDYVKLYDYTYSKLSGSVLDNTTDYTYDGSGNQLTAEDSDGNGELYTYYDDKVYAHPLIGPPLIPNVKRKLIKTYTVTSSGIPQETATLTYTFDSNDRISTETWTTDGGSVLVKTYTYY